jgi:hypothetical protein
MNQTLLLVWACIAIIGVIAIIIVKLYYGDKEKEELNYSDISTKTPLQEMVSENKQKNRRPQEHTNPNSNYFSREEEPSISLRSEGTQPRQEFEPYIVPERNENIIPNRNISYSSQNQVLVQYDNHVQKFQEPITETQRDIMNQNNDNESNSSPSETGESKHELKDLFTIDELIKESKRKDDERDRESKTINKETPDNSDIKESIKKNKEAKARENDDNGDDDIQESIDKMHEIAEAIKSTKKERETSSSVATQKDISEAIDEATNENEEEIPEISQTNSITDAVIKKDDTKEKEETTVQETLPIEEEKVEEEITPEIEEEIVPEIEENAQEEKVESIGDAIPESEGIKSPTLKSPTKVEEDSISILPGADEDYEFGASIDSSNLFEDENGELSDLDYRKDLAKFTNSIKNSSIVKDIRGRFSSDEEEVDEVNEDFIRNVNSYTEESYEYYDDYAPIINETHVDYVEPTPEEQLRQENTRRVFNNAKSNAVEEEIVEPNAESLPTPKPVPEKSSLKVVINSNEEVLRKGDEIIYNHDGETYSSKVYAINGDDIKVRYRRQNITIKPKDIKKIY